MQSAFLADSELRGSWLLEDVERERTDNQTDVPT